MIPEFIIQTAQLISSATIIVGAIYAIVKLKVNGEYIEKETQKQFNSIEERLDEIEINLTAKQQQVIAEQAIHAEAIFGILDGQRQQGLNHDCQKAWTMMVEHLNKQAHSGE